MDHWTIGPNASCKSPSESRQSASARRFEESDLSPAFNMKVWTLYSPYCGLGIASICLRLSWERMHQDRIHESEVTPPQNNERQSHSSIWSLALSLALVLSGYRTTIQGPRSRMAADVWRMYVCDGEKVLRTKKQEDPHAPVYSYLFVTDLNLM